MTTADRQRQPLRRPARRLSRATSTASPSRPSTSGAGLHLARPRARRRRCSPTCSTRSTCRPASRIAVQAEKSVESLLLYLAVLRAGHVYLPLNTAYKSDEIGYFIGDAEPAVFVCAPEGFRLGVQARLRRRHAPSSSPSATTAAAACSNARRTSPTRHTPAHAQQRRPRRDPLHERHHRAQQGRDADARQPALERA